MKIKRIHILSGIAAITLNTVMLKVAKPLHIQAEGGGLLKLVLSYLPSKLNDLPFWHTDFFWYIFHYVTGAVIVCIYFCCFEKLKMGVWFRGLLFSLFPWLINGLFVLPLLHQGIFGLSGLPVSGIVYFFFANILFGMSLILFTGTD